MISKFGTLIGPADIHNGIVAGNWSDGRTVVFAAVRLADIAVKAVSL